MYKKIYFGLAIAAMTIVSCSQDEVVENNPVVNPGEEPAAEINYLTSFVANRLDQGAEEAATRTITDLKTWKLSWNNGSTHMFGTSSHTGFNCDIDAIAFLGAGGDWEYLDIAKDYRQVFQLKSYAETHPHTGEPNTSSGLFTTATNPATSNKYNGLELGHPYCGYYFLPFLKDKKLPVTSDCPSDKKSTLEGYGYVTTPIVINSWSLDDQHDKTIQAWLAEYDFLQAQLCGTSTGQSTNNSITPASNMYDETTKTWNVKLDMVHTMALVELDVVIDGDHSSQLGKGTPLYVAKICGQNASNSYENCFEGLAAIDASAMWAYQGVTGAGTGYEEGEEGALNFKVQQPQYLVQCVRTSKDDTNYNGAIKEYDSNVVKFFFLIRQTKAVDHYKLQVFTETNERSVDFYPHNSNFMFEPGTYYKFQLKATLNFEPDEEYNNIGTGEEATLSEKQIARKKELYCAKKWQQSDKCKLEPLYPEDSKYWTK